MAAVSGPATRTRSTRTGNLAPTATTALINRTKAVNPAVRVSFSRESTSALTTNSRRSVNSSSTTNLTKVSLNNRKSLQPAVVPDFVAKFKLIEERLLQLESENTVLKVLVNQLEDKVSIQDSVIKNLVRIEEATKENISVEQLKLNTNIIVRGIELNEETSEESLSAVYTGIRKHLEIESDAEFDPVSLSIIPSIRKEHKRASVPIRIVFKSISAKRSFLQIRRVKKDIFPREVEVIQESQRPLLITEELTHSNQQLLYQARSLRGKNKYQFVWSNNGQVLARRSPKTRVIRISDTEHVNRLRAHLNLQPLRSDGTSNSATIIRDGPGDPQA